MCVSWQRPASFRTVRPRRPDAHSTWSSDASDSHFHSGWVLDLLRYLLIEADIIDGS